MSNSRDEDAYVTVVEPRDKRHNPDGSCRTWNAAPSSASSISVAPQRHTGADEGWKGGDVRWTHGAEDEGVRAPI
jgi:hypothetical protein